MYDALKELGTNYDTQDFRREDMLLQVPLRKTTEKPKGVVLFVKSNKNDSISVPTLMVVDQPVRDELGKAILYNEYSETGLFLGHFKERSDRICFR